jgi:hypothetical protein
MKEFRELKKALLASEEARRIMLDTIVSIVRQNLDSDIATQLYREVLVPNGISHENTVF